MRWWCSDRGGWGLNDGEYHVLYRKKTSSLAFDMIAKLRRYYMLVSLFVLRIFRNFSVFTKDCCFHIHGALCTSNRGLVRFQGSIFRDTPEGLLIRGRRRLDGNRGWSDDDVRCKGGGYFLCMN